MTSLDSRLIEQALTAAGIGSPPARLLVGFSGGLDSTVLLHLVCQWAQQHPAVPRLALHVNHGLQADADHWQQHCAALCRQWQMPFQADIARVDRGSASLEQSARTARYDAFFRHTRPGDLLLLAHHRDDQVETLLQRLLRGSGPLGLAGIMPDRQRQGVTLLRPLLEQDRSSLEQYADRHGLIWIEDPSNRDHRFERNFLRHEVLPLLRRRWPALNQTLGRSARLNREAARLLDQLAGIDQGEPAAGGGLPLARLLPLEPPRARNLIRYWLRQQGVTPPSEVQMQRVLDEMIPAPADARPEIRWGRQVLRRFQGALYCVPLLPAPPQAPLPFLLDGPLPDLPAGRLRSVPGQGSAFSRTALQTGPLHWGFRQGGEQLRPADRRHHQPLKQVWQERGVPPWWRTHWPLLYCGERLAGLPGLLVCEGFAALSADDSLWLDWQAPTPCVESAPPIG